MLSILNAFALFQLKKKNIIKKHYKQITVCTAHLHSFQLIMAIEFIWTCNQNCMPLLNAAIVVVFIILLLSGCRHCEL